MGTFLIAFNTVLPLFLIIFTGILFSRTKVASAYWIDILNKYALWIGFPALVINSLSRLEIIDGPITRLIIFNSLFIVCCILLTYPFSAILKFSNHRRRTLFLIFAFGNVAYLGIPVLQNVYGDNILPAAAILSAVYVFWLLTLGLILVEVHGEGDFQPTKLIIRLLKNPLLISVFVGVILVVFRISLPAPVEKSISMFSGSVTAVVLFSLGIFLGYQKKGTLKEWAISFAFVIVTMIFFPAIFWIFLRNSGMQASFVQASILDAAMPLGLTPYALAQQYNLDTPFTARLVVLATLMSIIILPLWIVVLGY
jgi:predicted permease